MLLHSLASPRIDPPCLIEGDGCNGNDLPHTAHRCSTKHIDHSFLLEQVHNIDIELLKGFRTGSGALLLSECISPAFLGRFFGFSEKYKLQHYLCIPYPILLTDIIEHSRPKDQGAKDEQYDADTDCLVYRCDDMRDFCTPSKRRCREWTQGILSWNKGLDHDRSQFRGTRVWPRPTGEHGNEVLLHKAPGQKGTNVVAEGRSNTHPGAVAEPSWNRT